MSLTTWNCNSLHINLIIKFDIYHTVIIANYLFREIETLAILVSSLLKLRTPPNSKTKSKIKMSIIDLNKNPNSERERET